MLAANCELGYGATPTSPGQVLSGFGLSLGIALPLCANNEVAGAVIHVIPANAVPVQVT